MSRKRNEIPTLFHAYINQTQKPSEETMAYVVALRRRIDDLELELALALREKSNEE